MSALPLKIEGTRNGNRKIKRGVVEERGDGGDVVGGVEGLYFGTGMGVCENGKTPT